MYYETSSSGGSAFAVVFAIIFISIFLYAIPYFAIAWKMFKKAGFNGWEALIPFYNTYVFGVISHKEMWMVWTTVILSAVSSQPVIPFLGIVYFVFYIILLSGYVKQYSAGIGFWLLYIFLPFIAIFKVNDVNYIGTPIASAPHPTGAPAPATGMAASPIGANPMAPAASASPTAAPTDVPQPAPTPVTNPEPPKDPSEPQNPQA